MANGFSGLDLDLHLGPPRHAAGLDLQLGPPGSDAGRGRDLDFDLDMGLDFAGSEILVESVGDGARSGKVVSPDQMAPDLAEMVDLGALGSDDAESKYVDAEQKDSIGSNDDDSAPAPNPVQVVQQPLLPLAGRGARRLRWRSADPHAARVPAMNLPLYYIGGKVLSKSDLTTPQARFLVPASVAGRIHELLTPYEIISAGFHRSYRQIRRIPGERASPTPYPGVPFSVSVYVSRDKGWSMSDLKLTKFYHSEGTVINGMGYRRFMGNCGMVVGDRIEVWAFRRHPYRLCFLMAKRDDVCPARSSEAME